MTSVHWPIKVGCGRLENPQPTTECAAHVRLGVSFWWPSHARIYMFICVFYIVLYIYEIVSYICWLLLECRVLQIFPSVRIHVRTIATITGGISFCCFLKIHFGHTWKSNKNFGSFGVANTLWRKFASFVYYMSCCSFFVFFVYKIPGLSWR